MGLSRGAMVMGLDSKYPGGRCDNRKIPGSKVFQVRTLEWTCCSSFFFILFSPKNISNSQKTWYLMCIYSWIYNVHWPIFNSRPSYLSFFCVCVRLGGLVLVNIVATTQVLMTSHFSPVDRKQEVVLEEPIPEWGTHPLTRSPGALRST